MTNGACKCRLNSMMFNCKYKFSARRSISIKIANDNAVLVSAPYNCPKAEIDRFVNSKKGWIERQLADNAAKSERFADIISFKSILVAGETVPFSIGDKNSFSVSGICVKSLKNLKKLYTDNLGADFLKEVDGLCEKIGLHYKSVGFKDYKSRWGCCDRFGNILFNYKLLMLPKKFWLYVAAHELCHTVYMDHSPKFYSLMSSLMPDYKNKRREMKNYSRLTTLY